MKKTILALFFIPLFNNAQTVLYNTGSEIYIEESALIAVGGGIENGGNTTTASIKNDGVIEIAGDFENKPGSKFQVYDNASSKERAVKFVGSGMQSIKGSMDEAGESSFYNLVIDKAAASDTVEMQAEVAVEGSLVFGTANITGTYNPTALYTNNNQKGLLKTYDGNNSEFLLNIQNGSPDAIAGYPILEINGGPATGFILTSGLRGTDQGGLQRKIGSATSYIFPVGTSDKGFNGAMLNFMSIPGGGSVKSKFCSGSTNPNGRVGTLSQVCIGCKESQKPDNGGYNLYVESNSCNGGAPQWIIFDHTATNHGYWSFESSNTGYQYDMEVFPNGFEDYADMNSTWRVLKHEAEYGEDPSPETVDWTPEIERLVSSPNDLTYYTKNAGCYNGSGVSGGLYTDFSHFTMGMSGSGNALPVKLLYIKADAMGKHTIKVSWATALEINNDGFEVLRSTNGKDFEKVGWVDGHDNSTQTILYSFDDRVPESNIAYYYKLRQVDNDGQFEFSNVVQAKLAEAQSNYFSIFPNPTANNVFLTIEDPSEEIKVVIYDMKGAAVYENIFLAEQAGVRQTVSIQASSYLPSGTYLINVSTNGMNYKEKMILQH